MRQGFSPSRLLLVGCAAPAAAFFAAFWLVPVALLVALPASKGWGTYFAVLTNSRYLQSLLQTLGLSLTVTLATLLLGALVGITLARQRFVQGLCGGIPQLDKSLLAFLDALIAQTGSTREMQDRRDTWQRYRDQRQAWARAVAGAWQKALNAPAAPMAQTLASGPELTLALVDDDVVENKIVASRMALAVMESVGSVFDPVRERTQQLEGQELSSQDILRPEACCQLLVEQWVGSKLLRVDLQAVLLA